jgi:hypothetical protein
MRILRVLGSLPISSCLTLILKLESGTEPDYSETVTIAFNAEHKVSIQSGISAGVLKTN